MKENITGGILENFLKTFLDAKSSYQKDKDALSFLNRIHTICLEYCHYFGIGDLLLAYGEELILGGDHETGIAILKMIEKQCKGIANQTLLCIRLAEFEFANGNIEACKAYLLQLCDKVDNYEESIEANGLQDAWKRCRHLVEDDMTCNKSDAFKILKAPNECTLLIGDILKLPQDQLLSAMSEHLAELSANGNRPDLLSEQERNALFIDEFIEVVNSDGLEHYFSYRAEHFLNLRKAIRAVGCTEAEELWRRIKDKVLAVVQKDALEFETILLHIDAYEMNFESEESFYYKKVEKKTLRKLYQYILKNADFFR